MTDSASPVLTVAVATRNRPDALVRCLTSLTRLDGLVGEVLVADDASDVPVAEALARVPPAIAAKLRAIEMPPSAGPIAGRNRMIREASHPIVLSMDDDAFVIEAGGIREAVRLLAGDPSIGAVAFAQAEPDGTPWPAPMQPAPVAYRCYVPAYIGFAHLLRRDVFLAAGGYDESFFYYGEEKDWCLRALDRGARVVYLPDVRVGHAPDPSGRSPARYLRYVVRNDCLFALRREPLPLPLVSVPVRFSRYFTMRRRGRVTDPGGGRWLMREMVRAVPSAFTSARVRWRTLRLWRRLHRERPAYRGAA